MVTVFCDGSIFIAVVEDWAVVRAEDDECIFREFKSVECFNEFADAPVELDNDIATVAEFGFALEAFVWNAWDVEIV